MWSAAGNTLQDWTGVNGGSTAGLVGKANPYTWTQSTPVSDGPKWHWSDTAGAKSVMCTATVTPPTGQGAAFRISTSQNVMLDVPAWSEAETSNPSRIDSTYKPVTGPALWAGMNTPYQNGSQWNDSVASLGTPYTGHGDWAHLQIITVKGTHDSTPVPNNNMVGLDGGFPYRADGTDYIANGIAVKDDGDSPGIALLDAYSNYNLNYYYDLYVMYIAPGDESIWVPLTKLTWTWSPNVSRPGSKHWSDWPVGTPPGGNPVVPKSGTPCIDEPTWTSKVSSHL